MQATASRSAHDLRCCENLDFCVDCQARRDEIRAARRDAVIHAVVSVRPRRALI